MYTFRTCEGLAARRSKAVLVLQDKISAEVRRSVCFAKHAEKRGAHDQKNEFRGELDRRLTAHHSNMADDLCDPAMLSEA